MRFGWMGVGCVAVISALLAAQAGSAHADGTPPKAMTCTFPEGTARALSKGQFKAEAQGAITFDLDDINIDEQSATLKTQRGTATVRLVRAVNAFHVLEVVTEGFLNLTTIYDKDDALGAMPAAHSRHFGVLGQPIVSQYTGQCKAK
ncbi:MAG: hypothetical protein RL291_1797 [Pseudomonadota bacterium]